MCVNRKCTQHTHVYNAYTQRHLKARVDELLSLQDRTKRLRDAPDAGINTEYLKACILRYMTSRDPKDKSRLSNVIIAILKLTERERAEVESVLAYDKQHYIG